jgi:signal transduction histidine kinase
MDEPVVLLVDDNPTNLKILCRALSGLSCRLLLATNGEEALKIAQETAPAVILLDVLMPGMDGFEICRRLKQDPETLDAAVIFVSGLTDSSDKVRGLEEGAADYIIKPFHPDEVVARVKVQLTVQALQAKLLQRNQELARSNDQKNQLLGMAAHDLRNPLSVVTGYASILEKGLAGPLSEKQARLVSNIHSMGKEMQTLLEDLLSVSQIESGRLNLNRSLCDPRLLVEGALQLLEFQAGAKEIFVDVTAREPLPKSLRIDTSKIKQALTNLMSNAIKFSMPGSRIQVRLYQQDLSVVIEVKDQGPGIPADELPKLFQLFQQTSVQSTAGERSTGLGLAISKRIVEGHGGTIKVESEVGRGTTFSIWLPLTSAGSAAV